MRSLLLNIGSALAAALMLPLIWGNTLDAAVSDLFFRMRGPITTDPSVVIVGIDDHSFRALDSSWPWPRHLHARLLDSLSPARVIVFDILFDTNANDPEEDKKFAQAIANHPKVILSTTRVIKRDKAFALEEYLDPVKALRDATQLIGTIDLPVDTDGVIRRARTQIEEKDSLGYLAAKEYWGEGFDFTDDQFVINYTGPAGTVETRSYSEVLEQTNNSVSSPFKDKLVFVGTTSEIGNNPNLPDRFRTPFSYAGTTMPGVEIHANVALNLLAGNAIGEFSPAIMRSLGVALAFFFGLIFFKSGPAKSLVIFALVVTVLLVTAYLVFSKAALSIQIVTLMFPLIIVFMVSLLTRYFEVSRREEKNRLELEQIENRISKLLASQTDEQIGFEGEPIRVFLSYSHETLDAGYMEEFLEFVKGLETEGIKFWSDKQINAGDRWGPEIMKKLAESDMAVTLVSQSYLDSEYCSKEVNELLKRNVKIVPVMLSPCEWNRHTWLRERQFIPAGDKTIAENYKDSGDRHRVYLEIKKSLRTHAESLRSKMT